MEEKNKATRAQVDTALENTSYDIVKILAKKLDLKPKSRRKEDAIAELEPFVVKTAQAVKLFLTLDSLQQNGVAEAVFQQNNELTPDVLR